MNDRLANLWARVFSRRKVVFFMFCSSLAIASIAGCGGNEMEKLKRQAMARKAACKTSDSDASDPGRKIAVKKETKNVERPNRGQGSAREKVTQQSNRSKSAKSLDNGLENLTDSDFLRFKSQLLAKYEQRRQELTMASRMEKVAQAFGEYVRNNNAFPSRLGPREKGNLSWRVELLPALGYPELYEKFDLSLRFNSPLNTRLIELIPPEYQFAPGSFTTNFVVPESSYSAYSGDRLTRVKRIEDGPAETIGIVVTDDPYAVPWTQPKDFKLKQEPTEGLVDKFGFGIAIFGDGRVEKFESAVKPDFLIAMLSIDRSDSFPNSALSSLTQSDFGNGTVGAGSRDSQVANSNIGGNMKNGGGREGKVFQASGRDREGQNDFSARLLENSVEALIARDQTAAYTLKLANMLLKDNPWPAFAGYKWCTGLRRPTLAVRWSAGIMVPEKYLEKTSKDLNPVKRTVKRSSSVDRPGDDILEEKTGQIGQDAMIVLRKIIADGIHGRYHLDNIATLEPEALAEDGSPAGRDNDNDPGALGKNSRNRINQRQSTDERLFNSQKLPHLHFPGIEVHVGKSRSFHLQVARERGNDLLLLFEVDVRLIRSRDDENRRQSSRNQKQESANITTIYLFDVQGGRELWKSRPLNSLKIREERKNALKKDAVFEELQDLDQFCRNNLLLVDLPASLNRDHVLKRLKILSGKKDENKIPFLVEARFYLEKNLILLDDYKGFCATIFRDSETTLEFVAGSMEQRYQAIKKYLPAGWVPVIK